MTDVRTLLVDLNNLSRYPTLGVGYLVAALRGAGMTVEVLSPLLHGVPPYVRERPQNLTTHVKQRALFAMHPFVTPMRDQLRGRYLAQRRRANPRVLHETRTAFEQRRPDVLLLSAYLDHRPSVEALCELAAGAGVPVVLGGPAFNDPAVSRDWLQIRGLTAIVGAEADFSLPGIVADLLDGNDLTRHHGVFLPDGRQGPPAPPLADLAQLPVPDFTDFPWHFYRTAVVPVMTGRGCSWGKCLFCSDIETANGRTFRSRPLSAVMAEIAVQSERHRAKQVAFLDIKLNGDLDMWRGIAEQFQSYVPGGTWVGTVHVQARGDNGLGRDDLQRAYDSGMRRISCGLETGSQRVNDRMAKGTEIARTSQFIKDAHAAGLSVRTTMMLGYPGETSHDVAQTHRFLSEHEHMLDRISMSPFKAIPGTRFARRHDDDPTRFPDLRDLKWEAGQATATFRHEPPAPRAYRKERAKVLNLVHRINSRDLRNQALEFDGV
ncbi:radical SAM protein [Actinoplanes sp. N902-109]|uniref:B12-binding domain-containing radical SAM protein n=1 Tax=Actinoplanes sp. (strain N902-109) TaxID=649831 RepID=UPI00032941D4|nr:radical SAM protein [Actinoplanes sp. N902-109]AGL20834.1 radical SAM domain-containing protein [Actinoplanes sp. N902-109]